mmetsp:Transcript_32938/g.78891  ORF Transcript_32938/g.78891 Transcript_32938/m.78891 type:complete len:400 (-) Transcript_32938:82-1281(-)
MPYVDGQGHMMFGHPGCGGQCQGCPQGCGCQGCGCPGGCAGAPCPGPTSTTNVPGGCPSGCPAGAGCPGGQPGVPNPCAAGCGAGGNCGYVLHPAMQQMMMPQMMGQTGMAQAGQTQPNMQFVMMPGGQMPNQPGQMPMGQMDGQRPGASEPEAKDANASRVAAGLGRNTQPKQGAFRTRPERGGSPPEALAGAEQPEEPGQGAKLRHPKNPWADIQDVGVDQEMQQMWAIQTPKPKGKGKKEGKDGGKEDGKSKDGGAKWVEKKGSSKGERRTDQWQPKDPQLQMAQMQMQSGNAKGKGAMAMGNMAYDYAAQATYVPQGNGGKKKGGNRDPKMDDWLSARFNGQVPSTPTGSVGFEEWQEDYEEDRKRKGKGGKSQKGKGAKGKSKGAKGGNYWRSS